MSTVADRKIRGAVVAAAVLMMVVIAACGSGGGNLTAPTLPSTTTTTGGSSTTTTEKATTTTEKTTTTTGGGTNTTAAPTTTTTEKPTTTTTTAASTTTTTEGSTTTTAAGTSTTPTTINGDDASSSSGTSPWLWIAAAALLVIAAIVAVVDVLRSRNATRARWLFGARDLATRSGAVARSLDEAAALLAGPVAVDRQVWLDDVEALNGLATTTGVLAPSAPEVPGDPEGTNSMTTALGALGTDLTVLRSAATEAERIRFELVGPTAEQLDFASRSVRQAAATVVADAHAVSAAADRIAPPAPVPPAPVPPA
jgi:hypothetical protein